MTQQALCTRWAFPCRHLSRRPEEGSYLHRSALWIIGSVHFYFWHYRARNLIDQAMSACRDPIRKTRGQLPGIVKLASIRVWLRANESRPQAKRKREGSEKALPRLC